MFGKSANNVVAARSQGVRSNATEPLPARGEPNTVTNVASAEVVFVQYYDGTGAQKTGLFFKLGDEYYGTKDNAEWTKNLATVTPWMKRALERTTDAAKPVQLPVTDNVDVD